MGNWEPVKDMLRRDYHWVVVVLLLMGFMLMLAVRVADDEAACHAKYNDFVISCYEQTGNIPKDVNHSWDLPDRMFNPYYNTTFEVPP